MIVPFTFIVALVICCVSATHLHIKSNASVPNILEDASEVPGGGVDLPEELHCVSALQVGTQLQIKKGESVTDRFEDTDVALWDGMDVPEDSLEDIAPLSISPTQDFEGFAASHGHRYACLGMFDSGTNLLAAMMRMNFPTMRTSDRQVWKHSIGGVTAIIEGMAKMAQATGEQLSDIVLITMVRSPISQVVSWKKEPYDLYQCMNRPWANMGDPCIAPLNVVPFGNGHWVKPVNEWNSSRIINFSSTMEIYNTYLQQYRELKDSGAFKDVLMIQYEDLVLDPVAVMTHIGFSLQKNLPFNGFKIQTKPAKDHGKPVGRDMALRKLATRPWMVDVPYVDLGVLCKDLDGSLINGLVEGTYGDVHHQVPYSRDCDGLPMLAERHDKSLENRLPRIH